MMCGIICLRILVKLCANAYLFLFFYFIGNLFSGKALLDLSQLPESKNTFQDFFSAFSRKISSFDALVYKNYEN